MFKTQHVVGMVDIKKIYLNLLVYVYLIPFMCISVFWKPEEYVIRLSNGNLEYIERYLVWGVRWMMLEKESVWVDSVVLKRNTKLDKINISGIRLPMYKWCI